MKEIKFRAMFRGYYNDIFRYHISISKHVTRNESFLKIPDKWIQLTDWEQFSGLHDKTGKEIYFRSDIVEATIISEYDGSETKISGVLFVDLKRFKISMQGHEDFNLMFADELEIIGNIHENSEQTK